MNSLENWHLAAQYLAMAAKSFLPHQEDDSHTNLGFDAKSLSIFSHPLTSESNRLVLHLEAGILELENTNLFRIPLDRNNHADINLKLKELFKTAGLQKDYQFDMHYELPFGAENYSFNWVPDPFMAGLRTQAHSLLEEVSRTLGFCQEIRIWPHHFDSGAFGPCDQVPGLYFGIGLAIPDDVVDSHYYYLSAYFNGKALDPPTNQALSKGNWSHLHFKGAYLAVFPQNPPSDEAVMQFYEESSAAFVISFKALK